jgi:hypothetical protein
MKKDHAIKVRPNHDVDGKPGIIESSTQAVKKYQTGTKSKTNYKTANREDHQNQRRKTGSIMATNPCKKFMITPHEIKTER